MNKKAVGIGAAAVVVVAALVAPRFLKKDVIEPVALPTVTLEKPEIGNIELYLSLIHIYYDNGFWRFMGKLWDALVLNILWMVCCIPLVTVGAATTAVYYVALKLARDEEGYVISSFFKSFKENFRQATALWLVLAAGAAALAVDCRFLLAGDGGGVLPLALSLIHI